jgi:hypothetical protein
MARRWILFAAGLLLTKAEAEEPSRPSIQVRLSTHQTCLVAGADIPCREIGEKLLAMKIPLSADIHIVGNVTDKASDVLPLVTSANQSLERAGYSVKRAYITTPAP